MPFLSMRTLPTTPAAAILRLSLLVLSIRAQDTSDSQDPTTECTVYSDPVVAANVGQFPTIWQPAQLLANDTEGQAYWKSIQSSIPAIAPKGDLSGNFTNTTPTYPPTDPDCWWTFDQCTHPKLAGLKPDVASLPEPNSFGLGFDDGPNCSHNAFYDFLQNNQQLATMFYIGSNCLDWPNQCRRGLTDGHQICVHTWSHHYMTAFDSESAFAELWYTIRAIKLVTGHTPMCWRPPFGDTDDRIRAIATALNLTTYLWGFDSEDWKVPAMAVTPMMVDQNYQTVIDMANNGSFNNAGAIMLTHELVNYTMDEAIKFYPKLKAAFGGGMMPITVALNETQPYAEKDITFPTYEQYMQSHPVSGNSSSSVSGGSGSKGGAVGMPAIFGLVGAIAVTVVFLSELARVI